MIVSRMSTHRVLLPLAAAFALTGGPALSVAMTASQQRAAVSFARQHAKPHAGQDSSSQQGTDPKAPAESELPGACFVAASAAKPVDTHGSSAAATILAVTFQGDPDAGPRLLIIEASSVAFTALHHPSYLSHAPPAC